MRFCCIFLASSAVFASAEESTAMDRKEEFAADEGEEEDDDYASHTYFATIDRCVGLDPPINNKAFLGNINLSVSSKSLADDYRNVSVRVDLRKQLENNPLLHFYITDEKMYSYQCMNRNSCTYKLCNPGTSQEKKLTKRWRGKCPLRPGNYEYEFVFNLPPRILHEKKRTTILNIQAQLHEGNDCVACYKIKMMFRKETQL